jgi:hypothetical protein
MGRKSLLLAPQRHPGSPVDALVALHARICVLSWSSSQPRSEPKRGECVMETTSLIAEAWCSDAGGVGRRGARRRRGGDERGEVPGGVRAGARGRGGVGGRALWRSGGGLLHKCFGRVSLRADVRCLDRLAEPEAEADVLVLVAGTLAWLASRN